MFVLLLSVKNNVKAILLHNIKIIKNNTCEYVCNPETT